VDEAGFVNAPARRTTWGLVGKTPVMKIHGRGWKKINAASALTVSPGGRGGRGRRVGHHFRLYEQNINGPTFAEFVAGVLRAVRGPVTFVWDRLRAHNAPPVRAVLAKRKGVRVYLLPKYAPELNPDEGVWSNSKEVKLRGIVSDDIDDLEVNAHIALEDITRDQPLLRSFFKGVPLVIPGVNT
jgi:putative transposase